MLTPRIKWRDPKGLGSADGAMMCRCDDGAEYVIKDTTAHPLTPHNEWFCTQLAGAVGVVCPPCCEVHDETGNSVFGSRCEGGVTSDPWIEKVVSGEIDRAVIGGVILPRKSGRG